MSDSTISLPIPISISIQPKIIELTSIIRQMEIQLSILKKELSTLHRKHTLLQIDAFEKAGKITLLPPAPRNRSITLPHSPIVTTTSVMAHISALDTDAREEFINSLVSKVIYSSKK